MLIGYWFLITPQQIEYDILITKVDQYLNDGVSFLLNESELKSVQVRSATLTVKDAFADSLPTVIYQTRRHTYVRDRIGHSPVTPETTFDNLTMTYARGALDSLLLSVVERL